MGDGLLVGVRRGGEPGGKPVLVDFGAPVASSLTRLRVRAGPGAMLPGVGEAAAVGEMRGSSCPMIFAACSFSARMAW